MVKIEMGISDIREFNQCISRQLPIVLASV